MIMIRTVLFLFSISLIFSCSTTKSAKKHSQQHNYIPNTFHNTYLGMPLAEFKKTRQKATLNVERDFRSIYTEEFADGDIKVVTYYFGTKGELPLYEYIIEYRSEEKRDEFVESNLGVPNNGEDWIFDSKEGFQIKAWVFKNKLVVTGLIIDTEWYNDEKSD
jgi:hypothetical protein